jgi:hypothetical protein
MSQIFNTRTTQKSRRNIPRRVARKGPGCGRNNNGNKGAGTAATTVANSIFRLRLKSIPGVVCKEKQLGKNLDKEHNYEVMYAYLFSCFQKALELLKKEKSSFNPYHNGMSLSQSLYYITNAFKNNIVPEGFELDVNYNEDNGYYFTIWKDVAFNEFWHYINVNDVYCQLVESKETVLLNCYMKAIKILTNLGFNTWWYGGMMAYEYLLEDQISIEDYLENTYEDDVEGKELKRKEIEGIKDYYTSGLPYKFRKRLEKTTGRGVAAYKNCLEKLDSNNPLVRWMLLVVDLINYNQHIDNYNYEEGMEEYSDDGYLRLDNMFSIIWSDRDIVFDTSVEWMDSEATSLGTQPAVINYSVKKSCKEIPIEKLIKSLDWLQKINIVFHRYQDALKLILKD